MDMQSRRGRLARECTEALGELFLEVVSDVVLGAEEDDASL